MWLIVFIGACGDTPVDRGRGLSGIISSQRALWFAVLHSCRVSWRAEASINKNMNSSLPAWVLLLDGHSLHTRSVWDGERHDMWHNELHKASFYLRYISRYVCQYELAGRNQTPHVFESVSKSESWAAAERVQLHIYIEAVTVNTESASRGQMKTTEDGRAVFTLSPHNDCWTESTRRSGRLKCKCSAMEAGWRTELWLENAQRSNLFISWFQRRLIEAASSDFLYVTVQHTHTQKRKQSNRETEIQADTRETVHSAQSHCMLPLRVQCVPAAWIMHVNVVHLALQWIMNIYPFLLPLSFHLTVGPFLRDASWRDELSEDEGMRRKEDEKERNLSQRRREGERRMLGVLWKRTGEEKIQFFYFQVEKSKKRQTVSDRSWTSEGGNIWMVSSVAAFKDGLQLQWHRQAGLRTHAQPQAGGEWAFQLFHLNMIFSGPGETVSV